MSVTPPAENSRTEGKETNLSEKGGWHTAEDAKKGSRLLPAHSPASRLIFQDGASGRVQPQLTLSQRLPSFQRSEFGLNTVSEDQPNLALPVSPASHAEHRPRCSKGPHLPHLERGRSPSKPRPRGLTLPNSERTVSALGGP